ncbi:UNVERIFIED_CONTAM: hypothetical protein GTU68_044423, partial [Idotea baltica]|nr:hypothetical protein [Idotea baltica]
ILGLGDTNYTNFCNYGKTLDKRLQNLKARRFYNCGWADDGTGLEIVVEPWIEDLFPALESFLSSPQAQRRRSSQAETDRPEGEKEDEKAMSEATKEATDSSVSVGRSRSEAIALFPSFHLPSEEELEKHSARTCKLGPEDKLTLPILPSPFLCVEFKEGKVERDQWSSLRLEKVAPYPLASSDVIECGIVRCRKLTTDGAAKKTLEVCLQSRSGDKFEYEPGDSFGVVVENRREEVDLILFLLRLSEKADLPISLSVDPNTKKKAASVPKFVPSNSTLRFIFTNCLDIRTVPKKPFLRALVEYTHDSGEKRKLMELVCKEGSEEYTQFVRVQGLTFIDLLILFPSCEPPVALVLEHLSRLLPRPYSITSSPLLTPHTLSFAFNVIEIPKEGPVTFARKGLCTGFLDAVTGALQSERAGEEILSSKMADLKLDAASGTGEKILIYFRSNQTFRLPKEINTPLIMVGPGTGVSPFIGFLKHRNTELSAKGLDSKPPHWLFFGCRHRQKDFLYESELKSFVQNGSLTELSTSFSREAEGDTSPKYVQDNLVLQGDRVVEYIEKQKASIYVCGDAKNMSKNVYDTFVSLLQTHLQLSEIDARKYVAQLQINQRYMQDVWG